MRSQTSKPPQIHPGMPVILVTAVPKSRNVYVVTSCDYRRGEATCCALAKGKHTEGAGTITIPFREIIPLNYFGVLITANTRLGLYAALPNRERANRTCEIVGKTIAWQPDKASLNLNAETHSTDLALLQLVSHEYFMRADEHA